MNKTELLNQLERTILIVAGEIRLHGMMSGDTEFLRQAEDRLGDMLNDVLELKKLEGIPSSLRIVDEEK